MKILDRYILMTFIKTFFSVFVILMFIFLLQTIWLYIAELAGKDLDIDTIFKFLIYMAPTLVPLVLPLTILLTSIMVFGNFAENYEFAAMKSTGISLQRAMRSLSLFIFAVAISAFFFANNVIPWGQYKQRNLRANISRLKPAMVINEGQFTNIGDNINIKVAAKEGDRDQFLRDVIIHKKVSGVTGNYVVIKSEKGELIGAKDSNILSLVLTNGNYYEELTGGDSRTRLNRKPFVKSFFEEYTLNIDLSEFNDKDLEEEQVSNTHHMMKISDLSVTLDTLGTKFNEDMNRFVDQQYERTAIATLDAGLRTQKGSDSFTVNDNVLSSYRKERMEQVVNTAKGAIKGNILTIDSKITQSNRDTKRLNKFEIAIHKKYVLGFACIILFFVGAPLGAIIRKGGMGLPLVVAIVFFLSYHFIGIFAENSAESSKLAPWLGSWLGTLIIFPLGVWLTYRATSDQGFGDMGYAVNKLAGIHPEKLPDVKENLSAFAKAQLSKFKSKGYLSVLWSFLFNAALISGLILNNNKGAKWLIITLFVTAGLLLIMTLIWVARAESHYNGFQKSVDILSKNQPQDRPFIVGKISSILFIAHLLVILFTVRKMHKGFKLRVQNQSTSL